MKKKLFLTLVILLALFSSISFGAYLSDQKIISEETRLKEDVGSTDLSQLTLHGYQLGEQVTQIDESTKAGALHFEDGSMLVVLSGYDQDISTSKLNLINGIIGVSALQNIEGALNSLADIKKSLGENYIVGLPFLGSLNTLTYVDRINNIEFVVQNEEYIYLKRIEDLSYKTSATPILKTNHDPYHVIYALKYRSDSNYLTNPYDYYTIPPYLTFITFPILLLFLVKDKTHRKRVLILNLGLLGIYVLIFLRVTWRMMMSA